MTRILAETQARERRNRRERSLIGEKGYPKTGFSLSENPCELAAKPGRELGFLVGGWDGMGRGVERFSKTEFMGHLRGMGVRTTKERVCW